MKRAITLMVLAFVGFWWSAISDAGGERLTTDHKPHAASVESALPGGAGNAPGQGEQSAAVRARTLLQKLEQDLDPLMKRILTHRYLEALEQRKVSREALRQLAIQQYFIVTNGIRNIALLVSRFGDQPSRTALNGFLQAEFTVHDALRKFVRAAGVDEQDLSRASVLPKALMFSYYETYVCLYGSDADLITAFYFDARVWIKNAGRVANALKTQYGYPAGDVAFFELYANYQPSEKDVLPWIEAALERGVPEHQIAEAARLLLEYELSFWEAMAETAGSTLR